MRVAYLINQYPKISHSFIRREILALERSGIVITRVAVRGWDGELVDEEDRLERQRTRYVLANGATALIFPVLRIILTRPMRFLRALVLAWRMGRRADRSLPFHLVYLVEACRVELWLRTERVQHVHAHFGTNSAEVAMLVHELGGPPWSFTAHGPEEFDKPQFIGLAEKIRRCAFVVAVSSFGRSQLYRSADSQHWHKVNVVHCGLEPAFYSGVTTRPKFAPRLVCVGRLCEQKGQLLLVEAANRLSKSGLNFEIVLAGDGELRPEIQALIRRHKLEKKIRVTGWISSSEVRTEILAARALVLPSFAEGLPVVLMEAMALKRPVISTFVAGIPELVRDGNDGWLVPAGDIDALVVALQECLAAPPEKLEEMGNMAYTRVIERHNIDFEAAKLVKFFDASIATRQIDS
jgi:colanic acid/amylovoran biosynthesis glycosyltransferase